MYETETYKNQIYLTTQVDTCHNGCSAEQCTLLPTYAGLHRRHSYYTWCYYPMRALRWYSIFLCEIKYIHI